MRVLLTNDDGHHAPGAHALARAVAALGWSGVVVAPSTPMSGSSRSRGSGELAWSEAGTLEGFDLVSLDATPAACVIFALTTQLFGAFDLCVSGVNAGENLGYGLTISGTFGAALQATAHGVRAIAISREHEQIQTAPETWDWSWVPSATVRALTATLDLPEVGWRLANINLPNNASDESVVRAKVSRESYYRDRFDLDTGRIVSEIEYDSGVLEPNDDITTFTKLSRTTVTLHDGLIS